jgi:outer membrane protein assembly factor BamB
MSNNRDVPDSCHEDFLAALWKDVSAARVRPLADYLAEFPGDEAEIARSYAEILEPSRPLTLAPGGQQESSSVSLGTSGVGAGRSLGRYRLRSELGRGGQGVVFAAEDTALGRDVALKVLTGGIASSPQAFARFAREASVASKVDHPGICTVFDTGEQHGTQYIVMRLVDGETLARRISSTREDAGTDVPTVVALPDPGGATAARRAPGGPATEAVMRAVALVEECARALHAAHAAGVVHRDVKPGNIMVDPRGRPILLDFGLARDTRGDLPSITESGDFFGTLAYMSPEQLVADAVPLDARTDVYSLGVTLFECLTLQRPFEATTREGLIEAIRQREPNARRLNSAIPRDLDVVLQTALEQDRERRYPSALDFAEDLRRVRSDVPILARPAGWPTRARRCVRRHRRVATATVLVLALLATAAAWSIAFAPRYGFLHVETSLGEALIELTPLAGEGSTERHLLPSADLELPVGAYRLTTKKRNFLTRAPRTVTIGADAVTSVNVGLEPIERPHGFTLPARNYAQAPMLADLDEDGRIDLVTASTGGSEARRSWALEVISRSHPHPFWSTEGMGYLSSMSLADFDADGLPDVAAVIRSPAGLVVLSGRDGSVSWQRDLSPEPWQQHVVGDFDRDGAVDLIVGSSRGGLQAWSPRKNQLLWSAIESGIESGSYVVGLRVMDAPSERPVLFSVRALAPGGRSELRLHSAADGLPIWREELDFSGICFGPADSRGAWFGTADGRLGRATLDGIVMVGDPGKDEIKAVLGIGPDGDEGASIAAVFRSGAVGIVSAELTLDVRRALEPGRKATGPAVTTTRAAQDEPGGGLDLVIESVAGGSAGPSGCRIECVPLGGGDRQTYELGDRSLVALIAGDFDNDGSTEPLVLTMARHDPIVSSAHLLDFRPAGLLWRTATEGQVWSSPAIADVTGDLALEIVVGSNDEQVYALAGNDGHVLWKRATGGAVYASPVVSDLNGDGSREVVVGSDDRGLHVLSGDDGTPLWRFETGAEIFAQAALADLDGDSQPDVVCASQDGSVYVLRGKDGALVRRMRAGENRSFLSSPHLMDVDGEPPLDILLGTFDGRVCAFAGEDGRPLFAVQLAENASAGEREIRSSARTADLDRDGKPEVVIGGGDGFVYAVSGSEPRRILWKAETPNRQVNSSPALSDLDGDGIEDVVVGGADGARGSPSTSVIALSGADGSRLWAFRTGGGTWSSPALAELDGDGVDDVVIGSQEGTCYVLSGRDGALLRRYMTASAIYSSPRIGDIDGDGTPEAVFGSYDHHVYAFSLLPRDLARRRRVPPLVRAREHLAARAYEAVLRELEAGSRPTPEVRLACAEAFFALGRFPEASAQLALAADAGLRAPRLGLLHLLCANRTGTAIDTALVAACVRTDPIGFVTAFIESGEPCDAGEAEAVRASLEQVLANLPRDGHVHAPLAEAAVRVLLGAPHLESEPYPPEKDLVRADFRRALIAIADLLSGKPDVTLAGMITEPGKRFAGRWSTDPAVLRADLRLPPGR